MPPELLLIGWILAVGFAASGLLLRACNAEEE